MGFVRIALAVAAAVSTFGCDSLVGIDYGDARLSDVAGPAPADATGTANSSNALCTRRTCADLALQCGIHDDGCGNALDCGGCADGGKCQGGHCQCEATTCPDLSAMCGTQNDGCNNTLDCGTCANPADGCTDGQCACKPKSCEDQGVVCGRIPDGCGNELTCGECTDPSLPYCTAGHCEATACAPKTCAQLGKNCDGVSDGCGDILACGSCTAPATCGGGGTANVCGCKPLTCAQLGATCGAQPNGCGGTVECGACLSPSSCGGGGNPKSCGCTPTATTCGAGKNCGTMSNGCGANIACGPVCANPNDSCVNNTCRCLATSCSASCGYGTDNCGNSCYSGSPCSGGGGCFVAGTRVRMADGTSRPIEQVRIGDLIASYDPATGESHAAAVTKTKTHGPESSADGLVVVGNLRVTPNHPLLVNGRRVLAGDLHDGDQILTPPDLRALRTQSVITNKAIASSVGHVTRLPGNGVSTYDLETEDGGFYADDVVVLRKQDPVTDPEPFEP